MDTEEEDISAIYINLVNMVDAFTNLQMGFIFFVQNCCKNKQIYEIFCFCRQMTDTKLLKGNRLLTNTLPIYSFIFKHRFVLIN